MRELQFNIPPGPIKDVLTAFEAIARVKVALSLDSIGEVQSAGVAGLFTVERALQELLRGTELTFRFTSPTEAVLELRVRSESVEVIGRPPSVQSPKYVVPLRDVAQTVALVPREVIEEQGAVTLSDVLRNVPGITLQAGEGGGASNTAGDMFNMRGFNASNSLFVDGVRDDGLIARDVFNLEQVEVFMGPTGSDVGRGTAAGYVNMQTKAPHVGNATSALVSLGSADQRRLSADFNWSLPSAQADGWWNKSAVRLNVLWQDSGVPGRDVVNLESRAVAPSRRPWPGDLDAGQPRGAESSGRTTCPTTASPVLHGWIRPWRRRPCERAHRSTRAITMAVRRTTTTRRRRIASPAASSTISIAQSPCAIRHDTTRRIAKRSSPRFRMSRHSMQTTNLVTVVRQGNERENTVVSNQTSVTGRFAHRASAPRRERGARIRTGGAVRAYADRTGHEGSRRSLQPQSERPGDRVRARP